MKFLLFFLCLNFRQCNALLGLLAVNNKPIDKSVRNEVNNSSYQTTQIVKFYGGTPNIFNFHNNAQIGDQHGDVADSSWDGSGKSSVTTDNRHNTGGNTNVSLFFGANKTESESAESPLKNLEMLSLDRCEKIVLDNRKRHEQEKATLVANANNQFAGETRKFEAIQNQLLIQIHSFQIEMKAKTIGLIAMEKNFHGVLSALVIVSLLLIGMFIYSYQLQKKIKKLELSPIQLAMS